MVVRNKVLYDPRSVNSKVAKNLADSQMGPIGQWSNPLLHWDLALVQLNWHGIIHLACWHIVN
jgi:hypothetical protein